MSYAIIQSASTTNAGGVSVEIELREKDATEPDPILLFPVIGYKLRFKFSDNNGLGFLNTELTLDILDDSTDTYFNIFNGATRSYYGICIKRDDKIIFWGFPDFQSLKRIKFESRKKAIQVKFYTPIQFSKKIRYQRIRSLLAGVNEGSVPNSNYTRFNTLLKFVFADYLTDEFEIIARIDALNGQGTGLDGLTDPCLFNTIYFRRNTLDNIDFDISYVNFVKLICEIFYLRWGFSLTSEKPCFYSHHAGWRDGTQRISLVKPDLINVDSGRAFVNDVVNSTVALPVINKNNLLESVQSVDVNPLLSVTYNREGGDYDPSNPDFAGSAKNYTIDNPDLSDPRFYDEFEGSLIPFDPYSTVLTNPETVERIRKVGTSNVFATILNRVNDNELSTVIFQDLTKNVADSLMRLRQGIRNNDTFEHKGILDPMRNHLTDYDDNIVVLVEGEWNLERDTTIVKRSITFPKNV
jgi:hypothetical protein